MSRQDIVAHIPAMRRYARSLTGDVWAADDLVQDTLERACSKWRLWRVGSDLRAWLFTYGIKNLKRWKVEAPR